MKHIRTLTHILFALVTLFWLAGLLYIPFGPGREASGQIVLIYIAGTTFCLGVWALILDRGGRPLD
jgi:hypothetical protein